MAPEVWLGAPATPASDQYALACVAFWMLCGTGPYDCEPNEQRAAHLEQPPRTLAQRGIRSEPSLDAALARGLAKEPADRFADIPAFLRAFGAGPALERADMVTRVLAEPDTIHMVETLTEELGLSEATVAQITDLEPSQVIRQRRLAARRRVVGDMR